MKALHQWIILILFLTGPVLNSAGLPEKTIPEHPMNGVISSDSWPQITRDFQRDFLKTKALSFPLKPITSGFGQISAPQSPVALSEKNGAEPFDNLFSLAQFVLIKKGKFKMGSKDGQKDEKPLHQVSVSKDYYLGRYEVTQKQWKAVMGANPSHFKGDNLPVETVSWEDAQNFIQELNTAYGRELFRLPTEVEWEYACRAGTSSSFNTGKKLTFKKANYNGHHPSNTPKSGLFRRETIPVDHLMPNPWGLYNMHGNVWELCGDWYGSTYYQESPASDPWGPMSGLKRVIRGGSWSDCSTCCRSSNRGKIDPLERKRNIGFRLLRKP